MRRSIFTPKIARKKLDKKHASTTAVCLRIPFQARIRWSCTLHTGLSCLFAFVRTPVFFYVVEKNTALTCMCRSIFTPKIARKKHSKKHAITTAVRLRILFQERIRCSCTCRTELLCCLRLFERPGAPTSLKTHGSYLHAQVDFTPKITRKKNPKKHVSTTAVWLRIPFQARIRLSCRFHTGISCLFAFVQTPGLSSVVEKTWVLPACAGRFSHPKSQEKKTSKNTQAPRPFTCASRFKQEYTCRVH